MKKSIIDNKFMLKTLVIYGVIVNIMWFFSSVYLEKVFFKRTYIYTSIIYLAILSLIITRFYSNKSFNILFFVKTFFKLISALATSIILYFLSWNFANSFITYGILLLSYWFFMEIILSESPFKKLNLRFLTHQLIVFTATLTSHYFLLSNSSYYYYGVPFLYSVWILIMSIYLFLTKKTEW
jgi:hypothetical protein